MRQLKTRLIKKNQPRHIWVGLSNIFFQSGTLCYPVFILFFIVVQFSSAIKRIWIWDI